MTSKTVEKAAIEVTPEILAEANKSVLSDSFLGDLQSFDEAMAALTANGIGIDTIEDYGSGVRLIDDKDELLKTPFLILEWAFRKGDNGDFVSVVAMTSKNDKIVFNDGSTGIMKQLMDVTVKRISEGRPNPQAGLGVKNGLRKSDYETVVDGKTIKATTYYLG